MERISRDQNVSAETDMRDASPFNPLADGACTSAGDLRSLRDLVSGPNIPVQFCSHISNITSHGMKLQ